MKIEITYSRYPNMKEAMRHYIKYFGLKTLIVLVTTALFEMVKDWTLEEVNRLTH